MGDDVSQASAKSGSARGRMKGRGRGNGPVLYDFRRPTKLSREHVRSLQIAYESFARQWTTLLSSKLRTVSQVALVSIEQLTYAEYLESLENPTVLAMVELEPLPGVSIFEFSLSTALACVDHMLGGPGGPQRQRALTEIETPLVHILLEQILAELRIAFEPIAQIRPRLTGVEYNPQFVQASGASEAMIVGSFEMRVGTEDCVATICMPFGSVFAKLQGEQGGSSLTEAQRVAREQAQRNMAANLHGTPIDVSVRFGSVRMAPADLIALRPGDIVQLNHAVTMPLEVSSAGITFAHAVPGSSGKRLACLVVPPPQEENR
jgi:flagellar motor switch protein FliM